MAFEDRNHLSRLEFTYHQFPIYFITVCVKDRRPILNSHDFHSTAIETWKSGSKAHLWSTGPYVIMPDHVHFFCRQQNENAVSLSIFVGGWKEWTSKKSRFSPEIERPLWQKEFFDHAMRTDESLREKIIYVEMNPVRAGLSSSPEDWPFSGNIDNWGTVQGD